MTTTTEPSKKIRVEYLSADRKGDDGKQARVRAFVLSNPKSFDEALLEAKRRAQNEGFEVQSANFRATEDGALSSIVVYVKGGKR